MGNVDIFYGHLEYFTIFYDHFVFSRYIFSGFGIMHREKSGNPASDERSESLNFANRLSGAKEFDHEPEDFVVAENDVRGRRLRHLRLHLFLALPGPGVDFRKLDFGRNARRKLN
jgi:hypothetical protein